MSDELVKFKEKFDKSMAILEAQGIIDEWRRRSELFVNSKNGEKGKVTQDSQVSNSEPAVASLDKNTVDKDTL